MEAGGAIGSFAAVSKGIPPVLPVPLSIGGHLRVVQPIQPGAGALGKGALYIMQGVSESMSGGSASGGDFPFTGMHPLREMCGSLPGEMCPI